MTSLLTAPVKFRRGLLLSIIAISIVNIAFTPKLDYSIFSQSYSSSATELSLRHLRHVNATAGMILYEMRELHSVHDQTTPRYQQSKNRTSFPRRDHPHAGARDEYGKWGYVADHQIVRKRMLEMYKRHSGKQDATYNDMIRFLPLIDVSENETKKICDTPPRLGIERKAWDMMVRKIEIGGPAPLPLDPTKHPREPSKGWKSLNLSAPIPPFDPKMRPYRNTPHPPKIGCFMYTVKKRHAQLRSAGQTWGWRCDGFLGLSNLTVPEIGAVELPFRGGEHFDNVWQKVRSIWAYIHDNYIDDFDYFYLGGDDTYVIVENLRNYLWSIDDEKGTKPLYIGSHFVFKNFGICGGGTGYIFNKVTLRRLVAEVLPYFHVNERTSKEDVNIGVGLRSIVRCYLTHDAQGATRFFGFLPQTLANFNGTNNEWFQSMFKMHDDLPTIKFYFNRSFLGEDLLSSQLITWHWLKKAIELKRVTAIMYRTCPRGTVLGNALYMVDKNKTHSRDSR